MPIPRKRVLDRWHELQRLILERRTSDPDGPRSPFVVFRVEVAIDDLRAEPGDLIMLDPEECDQPVALYRPLPVTAVLDVVARLGDLELLSPRSGWSQEDAGERTATG